MKSLGKKLLLLVLLAAAPAGASCEGWSLGDADWTRMSLGIVSGIVAHEAGHLVVAKSKGYRVSHDGMSITYPGVNFTRSGQLQLASAGYQTQWIWSELVLRNAGRNERRTMPDDFDAGVVLSSVGVSVAYLTFLKDQYNGDVYGVSRASGMSHDRTALLMAIPALLDGWRLFGEDVPEWVPGMALASKGLWMGWVWSY